MEQRTEHVKSVSTLMTAGIQPFIRMSIHLPIHRSSAYSNTVELQFAMRVVVVLREEEEAEANAERKFSVSMWDSASVYV